METYKKYNRTEKAELKPWTKDTNMNRVSVSDEDYKNGSPKEGDMIARNPKNHDDVWLVSKEYFECNFEEV